METENSVLKTKYWIFNSKNCLVSVKLNNLGIFNFNSNIPTYKHIKLLSKLLFQKVLHSKILSKNTLLMNLEFSISISTTNENLSLIDNPFFLHQNHAQ